MHVAIYIGHKGSWGNVLVTLVFTAMHDLLIIDSICTEGMRVSFASVYNIYYYITSSYHDQHAGLRSGSKLKF